MDVIASVVDGSAAAGLTVDVIAPPGIAPWDPHPEVRWREVSAQGGRLALMRRMRSRLSEIPGVVITTGYRTPWLVDGRAGVARRTVALIQAYEPETHVHYGAQPVWVKPLLRAIAHAGYARPAHRIAVSRDVAQRVGLSRVHEVISPGIKENWLLAPPRENRGRAVTVGVIGNSAPIKGVNFALTAFNQLQRRYPTVRFVVYDARYPMTNLPQYVERSTHDSIADFYRDCDVFVFPSLLEGFGLPPLEAMASGTAVVVTDCGGPRDYAVDETNCLLVPPGSSHAIVNAIARLIELPGLRNGIARAGRATAERFPRARFVERVVDRINLEIKKL